MIQDKSTFKMEIHSIQFTGDSVDAIEVDFNTRIKVINGASNTGKSFLVDSIDYMFGKESIDKIEQSKPYSEISLQLSINSEPFTLFRGFPSSELRLFQGHIKKTIKELHLSDYKVGSLKNGEESLNCFFLKRWDLQNVKLAKNLSAEKVKLTIRLLSVIICSYEERIIDKHSPIEANDRDKTINRNLFNYLLTGKDYSSFEELTKREIFDGQKVGRTNLLIELIDKLKDDVEYNNDSIMDLKNYQEKLENAISNNNSKLKVAQSKISELLIRKVEISAEYSEKAERLNNIRTNLANFSQLIRIYKSDIHRLESQEEAAFLLSVNHNGYCGTCGNKSDNICSDLVDIDKLKSASLAEIRKIKIKESELLLTINSVTKQGKNISISMDDLAKELKSLEEDISLRTSSLQIDDSHNSLLIKQHASYQKNIISLEMIEDFQLRLQRSETEKPPKKYKSPDFHPSDDIMTDFCRIYSDVLTEIKYPGNKIVTFDAKVKYDVLIDGNPRHLNGKGVRAVLHSVFKIATLLYCNKNNLFHPKLVILDSPLVTYRDPTESKHGELSEDEKKLTGTKLSYYFLKYLDKISDIAQFIIIENIDIPEIYSKNISVETFHGKNFPGRRGLF